MTVLVTPREGTGTCSWQVDTLMRADGLAVVERAAGSVRVLVGDANPSDVPGDDAGVGEPDATEVLLGPDGRVVVRSHASPPALLVTRAGCRLLPAAPATEDEIVLAPGDVVVLCSAEALGSLPTGLGGVLNHSPLRLGLHDPHTLLEELMTGSDVGAAAVAACLPGRAGCSPSRRLDDEPFVPETVPHAPIPHGGPR